MRGETVLHCRNVSQSFGGNGVLHGIGLEVARGSIVSVVGPSGCGKTTLLRGILGTHPPQSGEIVVRSSLGVERRVNAPGRDRGIVYQQYSLFPFLNALENVALGLRLGQGGMLSCILRFSRWRQAKKQHFNEAAELLAQFGLANALKLYPAQMSGGMRQRVALAQALMAKPEILLLDEPFGALDELARKDLQRMLLRLYQKNVQACKQGEPAPYTILMVTHDLNEAIYVGNRVVGLSQHWNWQVAGFANIPALGFVYDSPAPIYLPEDAADERDWEDQCNELRDAIFPRGRSEQDGPSLQRRFRPAPDASAA